MKSLFLLMVPLMATVFATGCRTTESARAKPLKTVYGDNVDLSRYQIATVQPFEVATSKAANDQVGMTLATDIANRLQYDFGPLFQAVRVGPPQGSPNELVVSGRITDYRPGSRFARLLGPGIGRAELEGELVLKDSVSGQPLVIAPIDKLWAWGHSLGAMKGMDNMINETAASAANLIARSKGWGAYDRPVGSSTLGP
jgi:hypothetical protein